MASELAIKTVISSLVHEIKTGFLKNPQGLALNGDIEGLLSQVDVVCTLHGLDDNAQRMVILQCIEASSLKALLSHLKEETKVDLSVKGFKLQPFVDGVRSFFAQSSPIHVLLRDLLSCPIDSSTPESLVVSLESFTRKLSVVRKELEKPSASLFLFSSRLPDWLRTSSFQYLLQNSKATQTEFSSYILSYSATRSSNLPLSRASSNSPSSSASTTQSSDSFSSDSQTPDFCRYCRNHGHLIDVCPRRIQAEARKASSSSTSVKGLFRTVQPSPTSEALKPFIGHPCVPCAVQFGPGEPSPSHIVFDSGSPTISLIRPDFAKAVLGFKSGSLSLNLTIGGIRSIVNFKVDSDIQPPLVLSLNDMIRLGLNPNYAKRVISTPSGDLPLLDFFNVNSEAYQDPALPTITTIDVVRDKHGKKIKFNYRKFRQSFGDSDSSSDSSDESFEDEASL
jgi:hypothetical protein